MKELSRCKALSYANHGTSIVNYDSSSDSDAENNEWDFTFLDSDSEGVDDGKRLTVLVRKSYLGYLQRVLSENVTAWYGKSGEKEKFKRFDTELSKYAMLLERKALRKSLMASLYQRSMVQLMRDVKKSTQQYQLYEDLERKTNSIKNNSCNKEIQTDFDGICTRVTNIKDAEKPKHFLQGSPSSTNTRDVIAMVSPLQRNSPKPQTVNNLATKSASSHSVINNGKALGNVDCSELKSEVKKPVEPKCNRILGEKHKPPAPDEIGEDEDSSFGNKVRIVSDSSDVVKPKPSLEERLSRFAALFGDSEGCEIVEESVSDKDVIRSRKTRPFVIDWSKESTAQVCNLNRVLLGLRPEKRANLEKRFKDLFGGETDPVTQVTSADTTFCRRRIANIVVTELSRFYLSCRIGSKSLFKQLARYITDSLLKDSYAPDPDIVMNRVDKIFDSGRSVMTEEDLFSAMR